MKPKQFVEILLWHNHHLLAFEVARALGVDDTGPIYTDWAIKKLKVLVLVMLSIIKDRMKVNY
jgi:hypothetical protein